MDSLDSSLWEPEIEEPDIYEPGNQNDTHRADLISKRANKWIMTNEIPHFCDYSVTGLAVHSSNRRKLMRIEYGNRDYRIDLSIGIFLSSILLNKKIKKHGKSVYLPVCFFELMACRYFPAEMPMYDKLCFSFNNALSHTNKIKTGKLFGNQFSLPRCIPMWNHMILPHNKLRPYHLFVVLTVWFYDTPQIPKLLTFNIGDKSIPLFKIKKWKNSNFKCREFYLIPTSIYDFNQIVNIVKKPKLQYFKEILENSKSENITFEFDLPCSYISKKSYNVSILTEDRIIEPSIYQSNYKPNDIIKELIDELDELDIVEGFSDSDSDL